MISLRGRRLFILVPRTGGSALQAILVAHSDDHLVVGEGQDGVERFGVAGPLTPRKHASLEEYRAVVAPKHWQTYYDVHPELVGVVADRHADDIAAFGYRFDGVRV